MNNVKAFVVIEVVIAALIGGAVVFGAIKGYEALSKPKPVELHDVVIRPESI